MKLAPNLTLPPDAITQTFSLLARRGAGKTHTASVMAEEMLSAGAMIVVLDPIGVWHGLRSDFSVAILGGDHADVPLEATGGKLIAEFAVAERLPIIVDVSRFGENEMRRFVADFCQRLYEVNRQPLHVFIDEADEFAPQDGAKGDRAKSLGAVQNVVRRGRARGIGATLITQRSAVLNKSVLTQTECLIAMQTTSPHDLKAIEGWVQYHGDDAVVDRIMGDLPKFQPGEAWVYSPGWLKTLVRVKFRPRISFDSSKTPEPGKTPAKPKRLADVDLAGLTAKMAATIEKAKADDPKELRRRIAELERSLAAAKQDDDAGRRFTEQAVAACLRERDAHWRGNLRDDAESLRGIAGDIADALADLRAQITSLDALRAPKMTPPPVKIAAGTTHVATPRRSEMNAKPLPTDVTGPQKRLLDALAWWESLGVTDPSRYQVGIVAGINATGGYFDKTVGPLVSQGYVVRSSGAVSLTAAGRVIAMSPDTAHTLADYHRLVRDALKKGPTIRLFDAIASRGGVELSRDELGSAAGINASGGYFDNSIGPLSTLGLIERRGGKVIPTSLMFPSNLH